ncbi:HAMP domain-containing sensor histidine kinase [Thermoflexus sp.]|uniref:sensor histidine kinase n=1 Tax=Thermoflexus sp. TaxID=1969742 RepID=UPI0025DC0BBD|nr:HAMP domain-containing sensor histidine kinase [Thermoflexus sp.]MDW8181605.1 HAMP domain-containing sensor histidine kinase [Anaerolineae bacterium]MCS6964275.1 HAMP domain-containing histidine kinase [Thermoflexus sp.]MCS7352144.1 HAMP domain-containing histidine kinase [Thermoflexus sp.]MCX7689284.1 HAMP domain-containing histidine kinase [Thermoflexus sp.]MDW8185880.1 HAMP domain-containing sensor histidine kinase [Anaerolineae bacterium]
MEWIAVVLGILLLIALAGLVLLNRQRRQLEEILQEAQRARRELEAECDRMAAWLEGLRLGGTEALLLLDQSRRILWANRPATEQLNARPGRALPEAIPSLELETLLETTGTAEIRWRDRWWLATGWTWPRGYGLALVDITRQREAERARRELTANVAHDLRTPLTTIRLLLDELKPAEPIPPSWERLTRELDRLIQLVNALLDLARLEAGEWPLAYEAVEVRPWVQGWVERFAPLWQARGLKVHLDLPEGLRVWADPEWAGRALGNLLDNAIKFTPPGGEVRVRAWPEGEWVAIEVADTGPGIPPEDLPRIFERFYRRDRHRGGGGSGLGLAIARHAVEAHGGRIQAFSEPGQGARFVFTLPAA